MNLPPVETLALARLFAADDKGVAEKALSKDLSPLVKHRWQGQEWSDRLSTAIERLESTGAVRRAGLTKIPRFSLTDEGRRLASETLAIDPAATRPTWAKLKSGGLPALALGRPGAGGANLKVEILRATFGLDLGEGKPTIAQATDALAARLIGLEPGQKFTVDNILRKLLLDSGVALPAGQKPGPTTIRDALFRRELGDPSARKPLDLLTTRSVGARQNTAAELVAAVLRSWIDRHEAATPEPRSAEIDLESFARRVAEVARRSPTGWFGDSKVFIGHVRRGLSDDPAYGNLDDAEFKDRLIRAHRAGLLELGRADLVEAMDPADVRESATPYLNAVYHFVRTEEPAR